MPRSYIDSVESISRLLFGPPQHDHHMIPYRWAKFLRQTYGIGVKQ